MKNDIPYIIAVDFDGVLHDSKKYPFIGNPVSNIINYLNEERENGSKIILWTSREGEQLVYCLEWCESQGIEFDAVNKNIPEIIKKFGSDCRKVYADVYIDDRAVNPVSCNLGIRYVESKTKPKKTRILR